MHPRPQQPLSRSLTRADGAREGPGTGLIKIRRNLANFDIQKPFSIIPLFTRNI